VEMALEGYGEEDLVNYDKDRNVVTIKVPENRLYEKNPYELDLNKKKRLLKKVFDFWWDHLNEKMWFKNNIEIQSGLCWIESWITNKRWNQYN
jgi:hypothetical protein